MNVESVSVDEGVLRVLCVPGNGDCLFSALGNQIWGSLPETEDLKFRVRTLRAVVVQFFNQNLAEWTEHLHAQAVVIFPGVSSTLPAPQLVQHYLHSLLQPGFWGGEEAIVAVAVTFNYRIEVYRERSSVFIMNASGGQTLRIIHRRKAGGEYNHYDSVLNLQPSKRQRELTRTNEPGAKRPTRAPSRATSSDIASASPTSESFPDPAIPQHDPLPQAHVNAIQQQHPTDCYDVTQHSDVVPTVPQSMSLPENVFTAGTWNVSGCSQAADRDHIDQYLRSHRITVACLQETRMATCTIDTTNYVWFNVNQQTSTAPRMGGGTSVLVHRGRFENGGEFLRVSDNICGVKVTVFGESLTILSIYARSLSGRADPEIGLLVNYLANLSERQRENVIVLGDFNAHIGYQDLLPVERARVGSLLFHPWSNPNGESLKELLVFHNYHLTSSYGPDRSVLCTWQRGSRSSQIDHIVMPSIRYFHKPTCRCVEDDSHFSDHRMLTLRVKHRPILRDATITTRSAVTTSAVTASAVTASSAPDSAPPSIQVGLLTTNPIAKLNYHLELSSRLNADSFNGEVSDIAILLDRINESVLSAANASLLAPSSPRTPNRTQAGRRFERRQKELLGDRQNPVRKRLFEEAKKAKMQAYLDHQEKKVRDFFENLEKYPQLDRVRLTYRYLRMHRRRTNRKAPHYIPIRSWEEKLRSGSSADEIALLPETEEPPTDSGPTLGDVNRLVSMLRNNTAAGTNGIRPELLRYGSTELIQQVHRLLQGIWQNNKVPPGMIETLQIPIPKVPRPTGPDEYRRITLCQSIYKVYSRYLLEQLESYLGDVPDYQCAYHHNRSAEDQIFVVRQILDERWRKGRITYIVSLDVRQAFDTIDLRKVPQLLSDLGVPIYLTNRIISACLTEQTSLQWFGQRTSAFNKVKGIKQDCPLSPKLFVYLLHQALLQLQRSMPELFLAQPGRIRLPCLRVYADDILAILTDPSQIPRLLSLLGPCLQVFGLELNVLKTEVLIRDPSDTTNCEPPRQVRFGQYELKVVPKLRYLGAYLTSSLNRRETIADRVRKAMNVYHSLLTFVRENNLRWGTGRRLYNTVIAPIVFYGLKVSTLIKRNRDKLRDMELLMVSGLYYASRRSSDDPPALPPSIEDIGSFDVSIALEGRTINRKLRMARLLYWAHLNRMEENEILKLAAEYQIPGPLKLGRPCFTWATCVEQDIQCSGVSPDYLRELAQSREQFQKFAAKNLPLIQEEVPSDLTLEAAEEYEELVFEIPTIEGPTFDDSSDESVFEGFSQYELTDFHGFANSD